MTRYASLGGYVGIALLAGMTAGGCPPPEQQMKLPPTEVFDTPRRNVGLRSYRMKLAVFNFVDQTGAAGRLSQSLADMLTTKLFETGRFDLVERAVLRGVAPDSVDTLRKRYQFEVDALVIGAITNFDTDKSELKAEIRVMNAWTGSVMVGGTHGIKFSGIVDASLSEPDVEKIAHKIREGFPSAEKGRVHSISGQRIIVTLPKGVPTRLVKLGMGMLLIASGDVMKTEEARIGDEIYVGEAYVGRVEEKFVEATLAGIRLRDRERPLQLPKVRIGDSVRFK